MEEDSSNQNKNIIGLSFKDLSTVGKGISTNGEEFLFVNDDIGGNVLFKNIKTKITTFIDKKKNGKDILAFIIDTLEYIYSRLRVFVIILSVIFDLFTNFTNSIKDKFVKKMFWGRGGFLQSALQAVLFVVVFILVLSYLYRKPVVIVASDDQLDTIGVAENDVLVMNATLKTVVPQDRARVYTEKYTVKRGDTISSIAKAYGLSTETILWANSLDDDDYLKLGQELLIPPMDGVLVTVKKNDTVESLAKKYSGNAADIVDQNWLESPYTLVVGQELFIPNGEMPVTVTPTYASTPSTYRTSSSIAYNSVPVDPNVGKFLGWPVGGPSAISRGFFKGHYGIDIYPTSGQPSVVAAASGTVISAGWGGNSGLYAGYGYYVHIDHGNGYTTLYAHMNKLYVSTGQSVSKGQALGLIGCTGVAYGIHVHFELRKGASLSGRINPAPYMSY